MSKVKFHDWDLEKTDSDEIKVSFKVKYLNGVDTIVTAFSGVNQAFLTVSTDRSDSFLSESYAVEELLILCFGNEEMELCKNEVKRLHSSQSLCPYRRWPHSSSARKLASAPACPSQSD